MAIEIITDVPRGPRWRRIRRGLASFAGAVLVAAGLLAAVPLVMVVLVLIVLAGKADPGNLGAGQLGQMALLALASTACLWAGLRLRRGARRLVLFLRRFGFQGSSRTLTFAVTTALGRRWRLVTLDDKRIVPVGVASGTRRAWGIGRWLALAVAAAAIVYAASWIYGSAPEDIVRGLFEDIHRSAVERGDNPFAAILAAFIGTFVAGMVVLLIAFVAIFVPAAALGTLTLFSWGTWRAIDRAERSKALEVETGPEIDAAVRRVVKRARGIFAPRLVVLRAAHAIWQQVVRALAGAADVVLIDVSEPTENLLWEIEALKGAAREQWILVGRRDRVEALAQGVPAGGGGGALALRLGELLEGEQVLVYEGEERVQLVRFARSFRGWLEAMDA